jgi:hypothetical protein
MEEGQRTTFDLGRKDVIFEYPRIQFKMVGCRLPNKEFSGKILGLALNEDDYKVNLVPKSSTEASIIISSLNLEAFPAGTYDAVISINDPLVTVTVPIHFTRQYDRVYWVVVALVVAWLVAGAVGALRAAQAGSLGFRGTLSYYSRWSNWIVLITAGSALWGVYLEGYAKDKGWPGGFDDFGLLTVKAGGAVLGAITVLTAVSGAGAKAPKDSPPQA